MVGSHFVGGTMSGRYLLALACVRACVFFACLGAIVPVPAYAQKLEVHYINVGWGSAVLIKGPDGTTVLLEAGDDGQGTAAVVPGRHARLRRYTPSAHSGK